MISIRIGFLLKALWQQCRALGGFAISFRLLESLLFAPLAVLAGHALAGRPVVDSTALASFALSPRGALALGLAAGIALTIRLMEHAGLSVIAYGALEGRRVPALAALGLVLRELPRLGRVTIRCIGAALLVIAPLLAVTGIIAHRLLSRHDINYYLKLRPPEFLTAVVVLGLVGALSLALAAWLFVRWRWVMQITLFEQREARAAFEERTALTRGVRWGLAGACLALAFLSLAFGLAASALGNMAGTAALKLFGGTASPAVIFGILLLLRTIIAAVLTFLGSCLDAGVFTALYRNRRHSLGGATSLPPTLALAPADGMAAPALASTMRWLVAGSLVVGLIGSTALSMMTAADALAHERPVAVSAHRGDTTRAPENTLAAIREAMSAGAHFAEIDVQMSKDAALVITHDNDFSRLGGVAKKVWELTYDEIRAIPVGRHADPQFREERVPTLEDALVAARDRIKLNIELKYYGEHQPGLARRVVEAVRAHNMANQVIVQCLAYEPLLEVRRLAPELSVGYLLSINARQPARLDVNFLSVEQGRLDYNFVNQAHRRGQDVHAWTVNSVADMERLIDLGVDGLITDQPRLAIEALEKQAAQPFAERSLRRLRTWLKQ